MRTAHAHESNDGSKLKKKHLTCIDIPTAYMTKVRALMRGNTFICRGGS